MQFSNDNKEILDGILQRYKAQPVGNGYIDIIISKDNFKDFIVALIENKFQIKSISWWEFCKNNATSHFGMGGPKSIYYNGWFAELAIPCDNILLNIYHSQTEKSKIINDIISIIENKTIKFPNKLISFKNNDWLTPAIWLNVPDNWISDFEQIQRPTRG